MLHLRNRQLRKELEKVVGNEELSVSQINRKVLSQHDGAGWACRLRWPFFYVFSASPL
jgi:hypothetical protein